MIKVTGEYSRDDLLGEEMDLLMQLGLYEEVHCADCDCPICQPSARGLAFLHFQDGPWTRWAQ